MDQKERTYQASQPHQRLLRIRIPASHLDGRTRKPQVPKVLERVQDLQGLFGDTVTSPYQLMKDLPLNGRLMFVDGACQGIEDPIYVVIDRVIDLKINVKEGRPENIYSSLKVEHESMIMLQISHAWGNNELGRERVLSEQAKEEARELKKDGYLRNQQAPVVIITADHNRFGRRSV
ncbi:hypothetical protein M5K25_014059 [Dendrobium thyrsiflorum]|uniref:Uncharacterized protein n=1 Tax=Dendrobium thyrsiflorum TaxID=117978 RepID=A0ABD0UVH4_DENTH